MSISVRRALGVVAIFSLSQCLYAQTNLQYPITFSQFFNYYPFLNPAATGLEGKASLTVGNQFNTGYFSRVRNFYALGEYSTLKEERRTGHALGAVFLSNQEGDLLSLSKVYLQYAFHVSLSDSWMLSAGLAAGWVSFNAEQTSTSGKISSSTYDGSLGLYLHRETDYLGISSAQIFNNSLPVITEQIKLQRYYRFIYVRNQYLSENVSFVPAILYTIKNEINELEIAPVFLIKERVRIGLSYRHGKGSAYLLGIKNLEIGGTLSDLTFSYNLPWPAKAQVIINSFELVLSLRYK